MSLSPASLTIVGNAYEKDRAFEDVRWIVNVTDVKNALRVQWYDNRSSVRTANTTPSDAALKQTVRKALDRDSRLVANEIAIRTNFGEVTLDGSVGNHYEKAIAEQDTKDVVGVAWVTNNLFVRPDQREDWAIKDDIHFNLKTDAVTRELGLDASVDSGVVTLTGKVPTWYQRSHA